MWGSLEYFDCQRPIISLITCGRSRRAASVDQKAAGGRTGHPERTPDLATHLEGVASESEATWIRR